MSLNIKRSQFGYNAKRPNGSWYYIWALEPKGPICQVIFCRRPREPRIGWRKKTQCFTSYLYRTCRCCRNRLSRANNQEAFAYREVKYSAKKRGHNFTISFAYFCDLIKGTDYLRLKGRGPEDLQINRIKDELGYIPGNVEVTTGRNNKQQEEKRRRKANEPF